MNLYLTPSVSKIYEKTFTKIILLINYKLSKLRCLKIEHFIFQKFLSVFLTETTIHLKSLTIVWLDITIVFYFFKLISRTIYLL